MVFFCDTSMTAVDVCKLIRSCSQRWCIF